VCIIKHKLDESIERCKSCLVAEGYTQLEGINYLDTFSLVAKLSIVKLPLTLVATKQWCLH